MKDDLPFAYQFKVTLEGIQPPIWRRIRVPATYTFWDLHVAIQDSMGWLDCHLHEFEVRYLGGRNTLLIGIPDENDPPERKTLPGWETPILTHFSPQSKKAKYLYDFGDDWQHSVVFEDVLVPDRRLVTPECLAGRRSCPPEDCGGPLGYEHLLEILADPTQEEHEFFKTWIGRPFDPESFNPSSVEFDDPQKRWRIAFEEE